MKHLEEIVGALKSNDTSNKVQLTRYNYSVLRVSECVSNLLLLNTTIQYMGIDINWHPGEAMGTDAVEQLANSKRLICGESKVRMTTE